MSDTRSLPLIPTAPLPAEPKKARSALKESRERGLASFLKLVQRIEKLPPGPGRDAEIRIAETLAGVYGVAATVEAITAAQKAEA